MVREYPHLKKAFSEPFQSAATFTTYYCPPIICDELGYPNIARFGNKSEKQNI
jgi:hypothetical protein